MSSAHGQESDQPRVTIESPFWNRYRRMTVESALPYQWRVLNDEVPVTAPKGTSFGEISGNQYSHSVANLRIAAGRQDGDFRGQPFQDTDVFKWLESASYALAADDVAGAALAGSVTEAIDLIAEAQASDGYLDTKIQVDLPDQRFRGLRWSHELYTMGHFIEAAVAHYTATGSARALDIARRVAGCIEDSFGPEEGKLHGTDGHPEVELALARLYEATGERRWLDLAAWFIRIRGTDPDFWDAQDRAGGPQFYDLHFPASYFVAGGPAMEMETADGHAVRLIYLMAAMAKVGRLLDDPAMLAAAERVWRDIVAHRMYVTGNVGSTVVGEAFTYDDDLPNDVGYGETCASVGMVFYGAALLEARPLASVADVIETELFNGVLAGVALNGHSYFYVNPLEADPTASLENPTKRHVLTRRAGWFDCACCPANLTRLVTSLDRYLYTVHEDVIYAHQFVGNTADFGEGLVVRQIQAGVGYPWSGEIRFEVDNPGRLDRRLAVRIPGWAQAWTMEVDGQGVRPEPEDGFVFVAIGAAHTEIRLGLDMTSRLVRSAPRVREDVGQLAVARGPVVYTREEVDNVAPLWLDSVSAGAAVREGYEPELLGGVVALDVDGHRIEETGPDDSLYRTAAGPLPSRSTNLRMIPYFAWANRDEGQMAVWIREH